MGMNNNLLLGEVLAPSEVVGERAAAELDGVGARKVGAAGGQPLPVVQLLIDPSNAKNLVSFSVSHPFPCIETSKQKNKIDLVGLALLKVLIDDPGLGRSGGGGDGEDGSQAEQRGAAALGRDQLHPLRRRRGGGLLGHCRGGLEPDDAGVHAGHCLDLVWCGC